MYSNSKEQISLEEAYRSVHVENSEINEAIDPAAIADIAQAASDVIKPEGYTLHAIKELARSIIISLGVITTVGGVLFQDKLAAMLAKVMEDRDLKRIADEKERLEKSAMQDDLIKAKKLGEDAVDETGLAVISVVHGDKVKRDVKMALDMARKHKENLKKK